MQSKAYRRLIKNGGWRHALAVLMIGISPYALMIVDMFGPQLCNDGLVTLADVAPAQNDAGSFDKNAAVETAISDRGSLAQQDSHPDSSPASTDEDCFCCCSHVEPGCPVIQATLN